MIDKRLEQIDWDKINLETLYDWCEQFVHFFDVSYELSDVGIEYEMVDKGYKEAVYCIKQMMDKVELRE